MSKRSAAQVRSKKEMAKKLIKHHFGVAPKKIEFQTTGRTNFVFEVEVKNAEYVVRIAATRNKLQDFIKEQWATEKAREIGVPVPEILEVGSEVISLPYMLQEKINGEEATNHPNRLDILESLGNYARLVHSIPTSNFGKVFNWSKNRLSKNETWQEFLDEELNIPEHLKFFQKQNILTPKNAKKLSALFERARKLRVTPMLNHGDLRLKNVLVNETGKIVAIIDWENCTSCIAPYWDFSIALHDLSIDGKQKFLEGYGVDFNEFNRMVWLIKAFNLVNYGNAVKKIVGEKDTAGIKFYSLRMNGYLDLFSI
ncbi:MAG: phosphotransferase family protein [Chitinophagaceae bacterium]